MTMKAKMKLSTEQVQQFLTDHHRSGVSNIIMLSGGNWSQAFAYKQAGKDYVIRFGMHQDDYLNDQAAQQYASSDLPIPRVLEVGEEFGGYFAISERAFGTMIDELDHEAMKRVVPSLFVTLDAIRISDISSSTGFGGRNNNGDGTFATWREWLLDVNQDKPSSKTHGWKTGLKNSPVSSKPFEEGYASLIELSRGLPEVRSLIHNDLMNFNVLVNDDKNRAYVEAVININGDDLTIGTVHMSYTDKFEPSERKLIETKKLVEAIMVNKERFVLAGDFNATPGSKVVSSIEKVLTNCGPKNDEKTWTTKPFSYNGFSTDTLDWRLDYVFATNDIKVSKAQVLEAKYSDHLPILVEIEL